MMMRNRFAQFFSFDNVNKMIVPIKSMWEDTYDVLSSQLWDDSKKANSRGWEEVDLKPVLSDAFGRFVNQIVYGESDDQKTPEIMGMTFSESVELLFNKMVIVSENPLYWATKGLSHKL